MTGLCTLRRINRQLSNSFDSSALQNTLAAMDLSSVNCDVSMSAISRWRIGGPADWLVAPREQSQIRDLIHLFNGLDIPWMTIGHSSNLLFNDEGIQGALILVAENLSSLRIDGDVVTVEAGHWVPYLARRLMVAGLSGAEHIVGIPGTIGGLICMNGGSMRSGIGENVVSVRCVDRSGNQIELSHDECDFRRRGSTIQDNSLTVVEAKLRFPEGRPSEIRQKMKSILRSRRLKFPLKMPNCGSVFISDPAMYDEFGPPGAVIEQCGLKGHVFGDAQISPEHANFIVNRGNATAIDVLQLIDHIRFTVREQLGCDLRCEVRHVDPYCNVLPAHLVLQRTQLEDS